VSALSALLDLLPRTSLIVGKGGVGKTTCAVEIARLFARRGERTLLISTDPAAALATVLGSAVSTQNAPVDGEPHLDARQLSASELRRAFLDEWRDTIAEIIDRGTYLDRDDVNGIVDAALPGVDEIFALLALADELGETASIYSRLIVDTAPTGHTLRLLASPDTFRALLSMLDLMQEKHRFMVRALTHRYRRDRADAFLDTMRARIDGLRNALRDASSVAAVLITRDEPVVTAESERYLESLRALEVRVAAIVVNAARPTSQAHLDPSIPTFMLANHPAPRGAHAKPPIGSLSRRGSSPSNDVTTGDRDRDSDPIAPSARRMAHRVASPLTVTPAAAASARGITFEAALKMTIVAGKGGVGKSTVACALAIDAADNSDGLTLLVSTDPAPSIADALGARDAEWARHDVEHELDDPVRLIVRQMDATAAFARVRNQYQTRIDELFESIVGRGVDVTQDRAILRDLLALAPPGIDELFALSILGDALHEQRFARIIVDPAPTGHLLRLLEMPAIALDWSHRLMRLMLKYRDVVGLGETAQELLDFAKRTRAVDALLRDAARCSVVLVTLDEPMVLAETERLAVEIAARGIDISALVWNRVRRDPSPLPASVVARQFCASEVIPSPIGAPALREWSGSWHEISLKP
jgi:arsenite-transporting ATPase